MLAKPNNAKKVLALSVRAYSDPNIFGLMRALETQSARMHTATKHCLNFSLFFCSPALWCRKHPQDWQPRLSKPGKRHRENGSNIKVILGMRDKLSAFLRGTYGTAHLRLVMSGTRVVDSLPTGSPQALRFVWSKAARAEKLGRVIKGPAGREGGRGERF